MRHHNWRRISSLAILFILLIGPVTTGPAPCSDSVGKPLSIEVSLATPPTIVLGEPVILHYKISNTSAGNVGIRLGDHDDAWYTLSLVDAAGRKAKARTDLFTEDAFPEDLGGARALPHPYIAAGDRRESDIVVTRLFAIPRPGKYILTVHVQASYAPVPATQENPSRLEAALDANGDVLTQTYTVALNINNADPARISAAAEALRQQIAHPRDRDFGRVQALSDALFSMPEAQAAASWEALAAVDGKSVGLIADRLRRVHSIKAADILAQMMHNPNLPPDEIPFVSRCLNQMYNTGDARLREHIRQIAASSGITLPDRVNVPQIAD